jgi:hypothetical protein
MPDGKTWTWKRLLGLRARTARWDGGPRAEAITTASAPDPGRRRFLGAVGALPAAALVPGCFSPAGAKDAAEGKSAEDATKAVDAVTGPTIITKVDREEYARLRKLDLTSSAAVAKQKMMPSGKIGNLQVGRLISGSNLISMNMHARDLRYVSELAAHYNTADRVFMTLKKCEEHGVNTIVLKNHNFTRFPLAQYWKDWGGRMQWLADVITTDIEQFERLLVEHLELGAAGAYVWGGASDTWYHQKKPGNIVRAFELIRKYKVTAGICAHRLEPIAFCEKEGLKPDFYMATLHHDRYWSAHPRANRRFMEMYEKESEDHAEYHDNMFCHHPEGTVAFLQGVNVPWIAFKVLAAGAIPPEDGFRYAFDGGADFICVGMFDFQVEADAALAREAVERASGRGRPWA